MECSRSTPLSVIVHCTGPARTDRCRQPPHNTMNSVQQTTGAVSIHSLGWHHRQPLKCHCRQNFVGLERPCVSPAAFGSTCRGVQACIAVATVITKALFGCGIKRLDRLPQDERSRCLHKGNCGLPAVDWSPGSRSVNCLSARDYNMANQLQAHKQKGPGRRSNTGTLAESIAQIADVVPSCSCDGGEGRLVKMLSPLPQRQ